MSTVTFRVNGNPKSQGSLNVNAQGRPYQKQELRDWRNLITQTAILACRAKGWDLPLDEPVTVEAIFWLPNPKKPRWEVPATALDLDKLVRAAGDALSPRSRGRVISNDARIVSWVAVKHWAGKGEQPGVQITITRTEK